MSSRENLRSPQPNSKQCFVCGLENPIGLHLRFYRSGPGEVQAECVLAQPYQGYPGIVHGGIVASMLDEAAGRSLMGEDPPRFMFTARLDVRYRKNVPVGQPLRLVGKAGKDHGRMATAKSELYNAEGVLLAEAEALLVEVPPAMLAGVDLEALGWKVYAESDNDH